MGDHPSGLPIKRPHGQWVQTDRDVHRLWADLIERSPIAARVMHQITAYIGDNNALIISQEQLAQLARCSPRRLRDAVRLLEAGRWLEVRRVGQRGTVNAYVVNDRVAWTTDREGRRYSLVSGRIWIAGAEQPDEAQLGAQEPLRALPTLYSNEAQLPTPDGEPVPDLPARTAPEPRLELSKEPRLMRDPETGVIYDAATGEVISIPHR